MGGRVAVRGRSPNPRIRQCRDPTCRYQRDAWIFTSFDMLVRPFLPNQCSDCRCPRRSEGFAGLVRRKEIESTDRKAEGHPRGNFGGRSPNRGVLRRRKQRADRKLPDVVRCEPRCFARKTEKERTSDVTLFRAAGEVGRVRVE